ncbi:DUF2141 domain-containing protein [Hansschlegelia beijingensis]|uniref:DUF2141 domain-containing protein n=1 Tax=Hansschlegelia beijingensis TaxID=1133344 RepID=UPI0038156FD8
MLVAALLMASVSAAAAADVTVSVSGAAGRGPVFVSLCSKAFEPRNCATAQRALPVDGVAVMMFRGLPEGVYAAAAFQDEDGDGRLAKTPVGLPLERFGFSNGVGKTAPPRFHKAAFAVTGDMTVRIELNPPPK